MNKHDLPLYALALAATVLTAVVIAFKYEIALSLRAAQLWCSSR